MSLPKVFVTRPLQREAIERIATKCEVTVNPEDLRLPPAKVVEACREIDGLVASSTPVTAEVVDQAPRLRVVCNVGVGVDLVDLAACTRRGIMVTNTPGVVTEATADLTFTLLLAVSRRLVEADHYVHDGKWKYWQWGNMWSTDPSGKTLGILGFGRIGQAVARRARGFNMRILYYSVDRPTPEQERELGAEFVGRDTVLREADFLCLHVPLAPETTNMITATELALMKPSAFIINTSRGKVINEDALIAALQSKRLAGAALDVFPAEPKVNPVLLAMPNVVVSPHMGTATTETRMAMAMMTADNMLAAISGQRPPNLVNTEVWGK